MGAMTDFQSDIYVNYAPHDAERVEPFLADLSRQFVVDGHAFKFWIDQEDIRPGMNWRDAIAHAILHARSMICFLSIEYARSASAADEAEAFAALARPIFPVLLDQLTPRWVPKSLQKLQWFQPPTLPLTSGANGYVEFVEDLSKRISETLGSRAVVTVPSTSEGQARTAWEITGEKPKPAKGYVFLSYAEEDSDFLEQLRMFFARHEYAYWEFGKSDRDYQKRIDLELESVIENAVATVSILSESWKTSDWSVRELYFSQEIGKPVFLLKAKPFRPMLAISGLPYIDFTKSIDEAFARLERELKRKGL